MPSLSNPSISFGALVSQTARQWRRAVNQELEPHGLTEATWLPLLHLSRAERLMNQKDLADSLSLDSSSVVRLLDGLQSLGLIERREGADRRAKTIHVTALGESTVAEVEGVARAVSEQVMAEISKEDLLTAFNVLRRICDSLASVETVP